MAKAEKHTLKLEIEKPQYITVNDVTYAQVDYLVIEAIAEIIDEKDAFYSSIRDILPQRTILCTNSLPCR